MSATRFETWELAFDTCRERNTPMVATVDNETLKIFPSGHSVDPNTKRDELHDARLADGLAKHAASMRRSRNRVERLRCAHFMDKYGAGWREAMQHAREGAHQ